MKDTLHEAGIEACGDLEWTSNVPGMTEEILLAIAHRSELYALAQSPSLSAREAVSLRAEYVEARREANRLCNVVTSSQLKSSLSNVQRLDRTPKPYLKWRKIWEADRKASTMKMLR